WARPISMAIFLPECWRLFLPRGTRLQSVPHRRPVMRAVLAFVAALAITATLPVLSHVSGNEAPRDSEPPGSSEPPRGSGAEGATCGTIVGLTCGDGLFCDHRVGLCNAPDIAGTCGRGARGG